MRSDEWYMNTPQEVYIVGLSSAVTLGRDCDTLTVAVARSSCSGSVVTCNTLCTSDFVDDIVFSYYGRTNNGVSLPQ